MAFDPLPEVPHQSPKSSRAAYLIAAFVVTVVGFLIYQLRQPSPPHNKVAAYTPPVYNEIRICDDAFKQKFDYSEFKGSNFTLPLQEGCFGGVVYLPHAWHHWEHQPTGDQTGFWYAIWPIGAYKAAGPFFTNDHPNLEYNKARLQGRGTILFYTNDVP